MTTQKIISILSYSAPMFSSLICTMLLSVFYAGSEKGDYKRIISWGIPAMATALLCWIGVLLFAIDLKTFVIFYSISYIVFPLNQVFLYRLVYMLTDKGEKRKFPPQHYAIPAALGFVMLIWSALVPLNTQFEIAKNRGMPEMPIFSAFYNSGVSLFFVFNLIYATLSLWRIYCYRKEVVNYSADEKASVGWLYMIFLLIGLSLPASGAAFFADNQMLIASQMSLLSGFLLMFQHIIITYNLIVGNYVIIETLGNKENTTVKKINRAAFEQYMAEQKPYLDPSLKITDICNAMGVNRTYLSVFINQEEYGMNFAAYINRCRMEELDHIRQLPQNNGKNGLDMILSVGFGSYRNYLRVKKRLEEETTIKLD